MASTSKHNKSMRDEKERTLDQVDKKFMNKILSRSSSMGRSSPLYHKPRGVPFQWEMYPGRPKEELMQAAGNSKDPPNDEKEINPLFSPEALSLDQTRPVVTKKKPPTVWFWKNMKKINKVKAKSQGTNVDANGTDNFGRPKSINSSGIENVMPLSRSNTTGSSIFSSSSSFNGRPSKASKLQSLARGLKWPF